MSNADPLVWVLMGIQMAAALVLLIRIASAGLLGRYPCFAIYLALELQRAAMLWPLGRAGYALAWATSQPIILLSFVCVVYELYIRILESYKGLETAGRWFVSGATVVATAVAAGLALYGASAERDPYPARRVILLVSQTVSFTLLFFLLLMVVFLIYYPVKLSRNAVLHAFLFTLLFLSRSVSSLAINVTGGSALSISNTVTMSVALACLGGWILFWNRKGENEILVVGHLWKTENEPHLARQLESINALLLRSSRQEFSE